MMGTYTHSKQSCVLEGILGVEKSERRQRRRGAKETWILFEYYVAFIKYAYKYIAKDESNELRLPFLLVTELTTWPEVS